MTATQVQSECHLCADISRANGEDPIGSAWPYRQWLVVELPQPWIPGFWQENPLLQPIFQTAEALDEQTGHWPRLLAIAPDAEYSQPEQARILYFHRPEGLFSALEREEYLVPPSEIGAVGRALLLRQKEQTDPYRQDAASTRDIMVCTHGNVDVACSRYGFPIYQQLRKTYANSALRVWRCSHFGGHKYAPTLIDLPTGQFWGHLDPDVLDPLIHRQGSVQSLYRHYRGWSGLGQYEQMLERELWMQYGWDWLRFPKGGETLSQDPAHEDWEADWAEVRIQFEQGSQVKSVSARIEVSGTVTTKGSTEDDTFYEAKQYRVTIH